MESWEIYLGVAVICAWVLFGVYVGRSIREMYQGTISKRLEELWRIEFQDEDGEWRSWIYSGEYSLTRAQRLLDWSELTYPEYNFRLVANS